MQKRALQGQTELNQNMSDSFRVTAYSWRVSQHANRPVAAKEPKVTFVKSESLQWCWSITAYSLLLWLLGISDELNMSEGLQMMGCFKKTNRQKLQKQHVYKIKTSSCSQTLSHCEVAGTHGWLQASLLLFTPFFSSGAQKVEDNWISIDGGNIIRKKIDLFFYFHTTSESRPQQLPTYNPHNLERGFYDCAASSPFKLTASTLTRTRDVVFKFTLWFMDPLLPFLNE